MKKCLSITSIIILIFLTLIGCYGCTSRSKLPLLEGNYYFSNTEYITFYKNKSFSVSSADVNNITVGQYEIEGEHYLLSANSIATMAQRIDNIEAYPKDGNLYIDGKLFVKR